MNPKSKIGNRKSKIVRISPNELVSAGRGDIGEREVRSKKRKGNDHENQNHWICSGRSAFYALCLRRGAAAEKILAHRSIHVGLDHVPPSLEPLRQELSKLGYEEGKTSVSIGTICRTKKPRMRWPENS